MKPSRPGGHPPLWVESSHWELDNPVAGDVLVSEGIQISGTVERPRELAEGIWPAPQLPLEPESTADHVVTGRIMSARDFQYDMGAGAGPQHGGAQVVLSVNGDPVQARVPAHADELEIGAPLTVRGRVSLVYAYEWDAFDLVDTRRSWSVEDVRNLEGGHYLLLLRPRAN